MVNIQVGNWQKKFDWQIKHRPASILLVILLFAFTTRLWRLHQPEGYVFDEVYHAVTAKLIARNDPAAFEWWHEAPEPNTAIDWLHPPLAKYTQAVAINLFGETSFAWRLSSALFGVGVIYLVYVLSKELFADEATALLAASFASLDGLLLVQSRIAMNDIHVTFFILLTLTCYLRFTKSRTNAARWLLATGLTAGLALGSKWSGAFVIAGVGAAEAVRLLALCKLPISMQQLSLLLRSAARSLVALLFIPLVLYVLSYSQMFLQGKNWDHFFSLHKQIWWYQTSLTATHPYSSRPWQWFLDLRPVWYWVSYPDQLTTANIYAFGNPILFWTGAAAVTLCLLLLLLLSLEKVQLLTLRKKVWLFAEFRKNYSSWLLLLLCYFLLWFPWQFSPRIMFFYHYTPAVALLAIILSRVTKAISGTRRVGLLMLMVVVFVLWYPLWTGIAVPKWFSDNLYFGIVKSWK